MRFLKILILIICISGITSIKATQITFEPLLEFGPDEYFPEQRTLRLGDALVFVYNSTETGWELWTTQGTPATTKLIADLKPGPDSSFPNPITVQNGRLFFSARTGATGDQLWSTNGTESGTRLEADLDVSDFIFFQDDGFVYFRGLNEGAWRWQDGVNSPLFTNGSFEKGVCVLPDQSVSFFSQFMEPSQYQPVIYKDNQVKLVEDIPENYRLDRFIAAGEDICFARYTAEVPGSIFGNSAILVFRRDGSVDILDIDYSYSSNWPKPVVKGNSLYLYEQGENGDTHLTEINADSELVVTRIYNDRVSSFHLFEEEIWIFYSEKEFTILDFQTNQLRVVSVEADRSLPPAEIVSLNGGKFFTHDDFLISVSDGTSSGTSVIFNTRGLDIEERNPIRSIRVGKARPPGGSERLIGRDSKRLWAINTDPVIRPALTGDWINEELNDQGVLLFSSPLDDLSYLLFMAWFTYENGEPLWLAGNTVFHSGDLLATLPVIRLEGLNFAELDANQFAGRENIGSLTLKPINCKAMELSYDLIGIGSGSFNIKPLFLSNSDQFCIDTEK